MTSRIAPAKQPRKGREKNLSQNTRLERLWYGDANACPAGMRPCSDLAWTGRSGSGLLDGPDLPIKTPTELTMSARQAIARGLARHPC